MNVNVYIADFDDRTMALQILRHVTKLSVAEILRRAEAGEAVASFVFFMSDHEEQVTSLRLLARTLPSVATVRYAEVYEDGDEDVISAEIVTCQLSALEAQIADDFAQPYEHYFI